MANENENDNLDDVTQDELGNLREDGANAVNNARDALNNPVGDAIRKNLVNRLSNSKVGKFTKKAFSKVAGAVKKHLLTHILPIAIVIFIAIGLISFCINMPGMLRGKMEEIIMSAFEGIKEGLFGSNSQLSEAYITKEKRLELLNYINDMGLDVIGMGFVTGVETTTDDQGNVKITDYSSGFYDDIDDEKSTDAQRDLLYYYIMANERAYIRDDNGLLGGMFKKNDWYGMLHIDGDEGLDGIEASVDRDKKVLTITANNAHWGELLNEDQFSFGLDGWTGRYGIPIEFSLALHIATMSSGMVEELITNEDLQTMVTIGLKEDICDINFKFRLKDDNGNIIKEFDIPYNATTEYPEKLKELIEARDKGQDVKIEEKDLSIEGLYYAYNLQISDKNVITDSVTDNSLVLQNVSKHIDTISAFLGEREMAVQVKSPSGNQSNDMNIPIYFNKSIEDNTDYKDHSINDGAYICSYTEEGKPNRSTGKLKASDRYSDSTADISYRIVFEEESQDGCYKYKIKKISNTDSSQINVGDWDDYYEFIPKDDNVALNSNGEVMSKKISALNSFKNDQNTLSAASIAQLAGNQDAYKAMLTEIDWFLSYCIWVNNWDASSLGFNYKSSGNLDEFYDQTGENINYEPIKYYTKMFEEALQTYDYQKLFGQNGLMEQLNADYNTLLANSVECNADEVIEQLLESFGIDGLTRDIVNYIWENFASNQDVNNANVKFVQPYIKSVVKHWFKDISFNSAYSKGTSPITYEYTGNSDLLNNFEVVTILTPRNGLNNQTKQPYVVKGDLVLCDGEVVEDANLGDIKQLSGLDKDDDYKWGDGYRATKKILTQGKYYTFDGTEDTTKSIFLQEKIEEHRKNDTMYYFAVCNGRITVCHEAKDGKYCIPTNINKEMSIDELLDNFGNIKPEVIASYGGNAIPVYKDDKVQIYHTRTNEKVSKNDDKGTDNDNEENQSENTNDNQENTDKAIVKWYVIYVKDNALEYISPTKEDVEIVDRRVDYINNIWDKVGVKIKRKPISLDNTTSDGQVMSITGLSILKNAKSDDADLIYRDLKEMLIELGYYTQAEFDYLDTDVLTWFIPEYSPQRWPQNSGDDVLDFAAILYPIDESAKSEEDGEGQEESDSDESVSDDEEGNKNDSDNDDNGDSEDEDIRKTLGLEFDASTGFEPGLNVIAPGDCIIISKDDDKIELEFDGESQPEIGVLDGYTMIIQGIDTESGNITTINEDNEETEVSYDTAISNKTIIKAGSVIGKTGTVAIRVVLMDDKGSLLSNVQDYMAPEETMTLPAFDGALSEKFYYYLGVKIEGFKYTDEEYLTHENGNVNNLGDSIYVTVGPGLLMDDGKLANYVQLGGTNVDNKSIYSRFRKDIILELYILQADGVFKARVEELLDGYSVSQTQMEALVLSCYQRGTGSETLENIINGIKAGKSADDLKDIWVTHYSSDPSVNPGVYSRRYAEWYLFKYGVYIDPYSNSHSSSGGSDKEMEFSSETPYTDYINGNY